MSLKVRRNVTYRPSHGTVAISSDWMAVTLVLAQTRTGTIGSMSPGRTRIVTPKLIVPNLLLHFQNPNFAYKAPRQPAAQLQAPDL